MALSRWTVKIPHRVRYERGQVARRRRLWVKVLGTSTDATIYTTGDPTGEELPQPLYSLADGRFPGYALAGRYDVYLDEYPGTAIQWDAISGRSDAHIINTAGEPTYSNSWVNYGSGYQPGGFMKDSFGFVHLFGAVKNGTVSTTIFTLPVGYRPVHPAATPYTKPVASLASTGFITIGTTGLVVGPASNAFVPLDGISFKAAA